jgi:hypothetical protein
MTNKSCAIAAPVFALLTFTTASRAQDKPATDKAKTIESVVKHCVDVVHQFPAHNQMDVGTNENFFKHFDAFCNPATGRVENNGYLNGDIPPQYQFNKCMASQGFPLK